MSQLIIIANITAKDEKIELVRSELEKLIDITRTEKGCLQYDLHLDHENPAHFMFYEKWGSRDLWQVHINNQHLKDYLAATEGAVELFTINEMSIIA